MPKVHKTCIYSKQTKVLIVKSHQTCIYSKNQKNQKPIHLCQSVAHRVWDFCFFWFFWVYAGLVTFHYRNFWFFWVYAGVVHFWHQHVDFFWVCAGLVNLKSFKPTFLQPKKTKTQNRYTWYVFSCLIIFLMKKTFIKCLNTMNISQQHYQWLLIRSKEELNINNCLTAIAKHIVETQTLHWKQLRKTLDM